MSTLALPVFNPMKFANRLKEAGISEKQAEAEAEVLHEALVVQAQAVSELEQQVKALTSDAQRDAGQMATKADIAELRASSKADIAELRASTKTDIAEVRGDIKLLRWMLGILIAGVFAIAAAVVPLALKAYFGG